MDFLVESHLLSALYMYMHFVNKQGTTQALFVMETIYYKVYGSLFCIGVYSNRKLMTCIVHHSIWYIYMWVTTLRIPPHQAGFKVSYCWVGFVIHGHHPIWYIENIENMEPFVTHEKAHLIGKYSRCVHPRYTQDE